VWTKGTVHMSEDKINDAMEQRGGSLSSGSTLDTTELHINVLSEDLNFALDLLEDLVKAPSFSEDTINRVRQNMVTSLDKRKDDIMSLSWRKLFETFYQKHPLHKDPLGTKESLSKTQRPDVINFYHGLRYGNNMIISVF